MTSGVENKTRLRWLIALLVMVAVVGVYDLTTLARVGSSTPPATTESKRSRMSPEADREYGPSVDLRHFVQQQAYKVGERNIFRMQEVNIKSDFHLEPPGKSNELPPPTGQSAPPITLKFYGFARKRNQPRHIFLQDDGEIFIAGLGDIVKRRYKVMEISAASVMIEDMLSNDRQRLLLATQ